MKLEKMIEGMEENENKQCTKSTTHTRILTCSENTRYHRSESPQVKVRSIVVVLSQVSEGASPSRFELPDQDENREFTYEAMSRSPSPIIPMSKKIKKFIELNSRPLSLEGVKPDYLEVAAIIADEDKWLSAKVWYLKPSCIGKVLSQARFCHGISPVALASVKCNRVVEVQTEMTEWLTGFRRPILIISADENPNSDVKKFITFMKYPYCNVSLPRWVDRPSTFTHKKVQEMKKERFEVDSVTCQYEKIHCIKLEAKAQPSLVSGPHCGFFDCTEILINVEFNRMRQVLYKMRR
jgi:hypothetical protein